MFVRGTFLSGWTEADVLTHRQALSKVKCWADLTEWLAQSIESGDLCWPLYQAVEPFSLGMDSLGGTSGDLIGEVIRRHHILTLDSQEGIQLTDAKPRHPEDLRVFIERFPDHIKSSLQDNFPNLIARHYQRAYIQFIMHIDKLPSLIEHANTMNLPIKMRATRDGFNYFNPLNLSESVRKPVLTWKDWFTISGTPLVIRQETLDYVDQAADTFGGIVYEPPERIFTSDNPLRLDLHLHRLINVDFPLFKGVDADKCGRLNKKMADRLKKNLKDLVLLIIEDTIVASQPRGGWGVWLLRSWQS